MASGIRAEIKIDDPPDCVVAQAAAAASGRVHSVSKSTSPSAPERVTEEFMLEADDYPEEFDVDAEIESIFSYGSSEVYRFERELGHGCPCECIEGHDCPVVDVRAHGSALYLTFHTPDMHVLQAVIGDLRERYSGLDVQRLLQSQQDHDERHLVFVDRSTLTDRQTEVLETAHRMGYFDHPKRANAGEVATELGITSTTFTEHLAAAQTKLLDAILDHE
ncbi:Bacterio-opsin activator HTH domain protein [Natrinema pellirubrum DSM 15624]|uniref:Bacterio-opsin activator HTH domain protein n=1 Tax=Natrinema pellirubrum (strain DSM 15624 / CIP 106293 / JCM 10476 / NCIMB 786 / 157) TaxID=797303 RepID=L0JQ55_NATP1|nr:helix-turn-helix domain-containing protein [Natrinema pellirubrum]AGB32963.1 putative DNA binding protein [Natrinema pellirubrum DSM 15624]ELY75068.1 Bacterio-opsin activator HTH domain protein [Natrinema pellirubrum DSM 15624]